MSSPNDPIFRGDESNLDVLALARKVQSLQIEIEEQRRQIEILRLERDRLQDEQQKLIELGIQTRQENLF